MHLTTEEYFLYHKVFEEIAAQGGISGFAHMGWSSRRERLGRRQDEPRHDAARAVRPRRFHRGAAGRPADHRRLVPVAEPRLSRHAGRRARTGLTAIFPAWSATTSSSRARSTSTSGSTSFDAGRTFVTNGPLLEFTVNGKRHGRGAARQARHEADIAAARKLNPDVDTLDRLELVVLGDVADTASADGKDTRHAAQADRPPSAACGSPCAPTAAGRIRAT